MVLVQPEDVVRVVLALYGRFPAGPTDVREIHCGPRGPFLNSPVSTPSAGNYTKLSKSDPHRGRACQWPLRRCWNPTTRTTATRLFRMPPTPTELGVAPSHLGDALGSHAVSSAAHSRYRLRSRLPPEKPTHRYRQRHHADTHAKGERRR